MALISNEDISYSIEFFNFKNFNLKGFREPKDFYDSGVMKMWKNISVFNTRSTKISNCKMTQNEPYKISMVNLTFYRYSLILLYKIPTLLFYILNRNLKFRNLKYQKLTWILAAKHRKRAILINDQYAAHYSQKYPFHNLFISKSQHLNKKPLQLN
ncbi:hypothetical protein BpHYR1_027620 [Brachionus plicatilis]|uniref:Uncharacterized protein n=1 Tax=Brachionus plicatilis TaxID=10195 RepID=A0A3M7S4R7_BRAPC|nr:hypothetical protein BpHYR1_027620 [Brachionus plicatilis]